MGARELGSLIKAEDLSLNKYLSIANEQFKIPYTQRPYEWNNSQIERLFFDIIAVFEEKKEQHILNFITIYNEDGYQNIYDGQQRTVSLLIIMCVIIHKIEELGYVDSAKRIAEEYIKKKDWRPDSEDRIRIVFSENETNNFFDKYIISNEEIGNDFIITDKVKRLKANFDHLTKLLNKYIEENDLDAEEIIKIIEMMTERMYVIVLHTPNEDIANQMFETLNNTGKKIANFYVLKNACVKVISEEETSLYWDIIESNTDSLNKNNFLSQFVSMFHGKTSAQQALPILEKSGRLSNEEEVKTLLAELKEASQYFLELHEPEQIKRRNASKSDIEKFISLINALKLFNAKQYRPVILAMNMKGYLLNDINIILGKCLSIQIRNFFIANNKANTVESFYPSLAKKIYKSNKKITKEVCSALNKMALPDEDVILSLKSRTFDKRNDNKGLRYLLKKIYDYENNREIEVNSDSMHVNLEHILPQNPKKDSKWVEAFGESLEDYIYKFGNLTLLLGKKNFSLGNKEFKEKRIELAQSKIAHNHKIAENDKWMSDEINKRTGELAKVLVKIL